MKLMPPLNDKRYLMRVLIMSLILFGEILWLKFLISPVTSTKAQTEPGTTTPTAVLTLNPGIQTLEISQTAEVAATLTPNGQSIYGLEAVIPYNPDIVDVLDIRPGPFFTNHQAVVGAPLEAFKRIENGRIHYSVAFPLGSKFGSPDTEIAMIITVSAKSPGCSPFAFDSPLTLVANTSAENVLLQTEGSFVETSPGACAPTSTPVPSETPTPLPTPTDSPAPEPTPTPVIDTNSPGITITYPVLRSKVAVNSLVIIQASATDNIGVGMVDFSVTAKGSSFTCTDDTAPYTCNWPVPADTKVPYTIKAIAYDLAGNSAASQIKVTSE